MSMMKANGDKPEHMTILSGYKRVPKTNPRIAFRGLIDTLQSEVIEAQVLASGLGDKEVCAMLGEVLDFLRAMMAAEVKETLLMPPFLFGMDAEELHRQSHEAFIRGAEGKPVPPDYTQGPMVARLNTLRAKTREAELLAIKVFGPKGANEAGASLHEREDIVLAVNRLSSAFWWLTCQRQNRP